MKKLFQGFMRMLGNVLEFLADVFVTVTIGVFIGGGLLVCVKSGQMFTELFFSMHEYSELQLKLAEWCISSFIFGMFSLIVLACFNSFFIMKDVDDLGWDVRGNVGARLYDIKQNTREIINMTDMIYNEVEEINWTKRPEDK